MTRSSKNKCIIESVDSIIRDGPDTSIYVIHYKKGNTVEPLYNGQVCAEDSVRYSEVSLIVRFHHIIMFI